MCIFGVIQGVLGFGKKKKSPIGFERVVRTVGNPKLIRRPPSDVCSLSHTHTHTRTHLLVKYVCRIANS